MEVQVFGHLRVTSADGDVELGGSKQRLVLLALILANGAVVSSDRLIEFVWGDHPPAKPNVTLRSYISHLRRGLEPERSAGDRAQVLITRSPGYAIDVRRIDVDLHRFVEATHRALSLPAETAPAAVLEAASQAFSHWPDNGATPLATATQTLHDFPEDVSLLTELHLALAIRHYRAAIDAGRSNEALPSLEAVSNEHPSSEELVAIHMLALYRSGRSGDALARFHRARQVLVDSYGLDPSPLLTDLEQQILANDTALLGPPLSEQLVPLSTPSDDGIEPPAGRAAALDVLLGCLPGPNRQETGAAVIGPAGIGKSTLLDAIADLAVRNGVVVVWGRCADTESSATLRPWQAVLRDLFERSDEETRRSVFAPQAADLCRIMPELASIFDIDESKVPEGGDIGDAIVRTLHRWSSKQSLLICIEDMHWSDPGSIVVLNQLLVANDPAAPSVIATWRDTDIAAEAVHTRAARTRLLADAGRAVGTCRIALEGLAEGDIIEVFRSIRHTEPDRELIRQLAEHTGGNPLFVTELIRGGIDDGMAPTDTITEVVLRRLDPLPNNAADILAAAALCHPSIDEPMLAELTGFTEEQLGDCCEAALAARLIEESPEHIGNYRFSHDLLAEALAGTLRQRRRSELHARIGHLLEKRSAPAADIAHHHLLGISAGSSLKAARFAHLAGIDAFELADYEGALRFFDAALDALDRGPDAAVMRIDVTIDRSQVLKFLSEHVESQQTSMRAFDLASKSGEVDLMIVSGLVYVGLARIDRSRRSAEWLGYWSPADESVDILERALERMDETHRWRPVLLLALSNQLFAPHHDQARAEDLARTGLELVRQQGDTAMLSESLVSIPTSHTRILPREERKALLEEGITLAKATAQPKVELRGRKALVGVALDERDLAEARRQVRQALTTATSVDDPFSAMLADSMRISLDLLAGNFPQARDRVMESFTTYARFGDAVMDMFGMQYFTLARSAGEFGPIIDAISDKLTGYDGPAYGAPLAATLARSGDLSGARNVIDRFTIIDMTWGGEGVLQFMTPAFFSDAVADLALTQPDLIEMIPPLLAALEPANDRLLSLVGGADYPSAIAYYIGRLHTAAGDVDEAATMLGLATEHLTAIEARPALLWTELATAENHAAAGDGSAAEASLDGTTQLASELAMEWAVAWAEPRIRHRLDASR